MSSGDQSRRISHHATPLTPLISARWEEKTGTEQLNHLYAVLINGKWNEDTEKQLRHLEDRVISGRERVDVTEEQLFDLMEKVWKSDSSKWKSEMKELAHQLYTKVMNKEWDNVINLYDRQKEMIHMAGITPSKQTALHIVISNGLTDVVKMLLDNIDALAIREMTDSRNENPLHLAASLGQFETCKRLVEKDPELIGAENVKGETPLFLAVLHGKKEAFYALHPKCPITDKDIKHSKAHCKRKDGNHILHVSIRREYFELAYQIIHWYPELIMDVNNDGQTALHLLAQNPSAFRSGCYLGPVDDFIYSCLIVDSDKLLGTPSHFTVKHCVDIACQVPGNYQICLDLLNLGKRFFKLIVTWARTWEDIKSDICQIFSKNIDRLPVKNTIPGERQETSIRGPIQDEIMSHDSSKHSQREHIDMKVPGEREETSIRGPIQDEIMSHDSSKHCQREHIDMKGDKTEPQMGPRIEKGSGDSTSQEGHEIQRASPMEREDSAERPQYPSNYHVFLHFLQFAIQLFLSVFGLGSFRC